MGPQEVSQLVWSMATLNFTSERVCSLVSELVSHQLAAEAAAAAAAAAAGKEAAAASLDTTKGSTITTSALAPSIPSHSPQASASSTPDPPGPPERGALPNSNSNSKPWSSQSLSNLAWSYAVMRPGDTRLFAAVFASIGEAVHSWGRSGVGARGGAGRRGGAAGPAGRAAGRGAVVRRPELLRPGRAREGAGLSGGPGEGGVKVEKSDIRHARQVRGGWIAHKHGQ
jgi:hypothetical protein